MENTPDGIAPDAMPVLSYDDNVAYEDQVPTHASEGASLANRIGTTKVYLLSESLARVGKRKHDAEDEASKEEEDVEMDEDLPFRGNALLLQGPPISHLPTARLFAYATHFDAHPMGLEWIDDTTCIFVFDSKTTARTGHRYLQKSAVEDADAEGFVVAKPIPVALWPPEERINKSLGKGEGLKGTIRMRWATNEDVKKKGAKRASEFYKKHGTMAGKEVLHNGNGPAPKRRRGSDEALTKAQLDTDLDDFLAEEDPEPEPVLPPSPPSKMRSDYIANDGRTLLERTRMSLASRLTAPLPRRARGQRSTMVADSLSDRLWSDDRLPEPDHSPKLRRHRDGGRDGGRRNDKRERGVRPAVATAEELDAELDAFLNMRD